MVVNGYSQSAGRCRDISIIVMRSSRGPGAAAHNQLIGVSTREFIPLSLLLVVSGHSQPTQQLLQSALIGDVDSTDSKQRLTTNNSDTQSASSQPTTLLSVVSGDSQPADRRHAMCAYCVIILVLAAAATHNQFENRTHCTPEYRRRQLKASPIRGKYCIQRIRFTAEDHISSSRQNHRPLYRSDSFVLCGGSRLSRQSRRQATKRHRLMHLDILPDPLGQACSNTANKRHSGSGILYILPSSVDTRPFGILKQLTTLHIIFPSTSMMFTIIFHSDFRLRICKIKEKTPFGRTACSCVSGNLDSRIDLRGGKSMRHQYQTQFAFTERIRVLMHECHRTAAIRGSARHPTTLSSNSFMRLVTQITQLTKCHPSLIRIPPHQSVTKQHQSPQSRLPRVHQPRGVRRYARDVAQLHPPHRITPIHASNSRNTAARFLRTRDDDQLLMIELTWHIDAQQFQRSTQRENQRRRDPRLQFTASNQCLGLDAQQSDRSCLNPSAIRLF